MTNPACGAANIGRGGLSASRNRTPRCASTTVPLWGRMASCGRVADTATRRNDARSARCGAAILGCSRLSGGRNRTLRSASQATPTPSTIIPSQRRTATN